MNSLPAEFIFISPLPHAFSTAISVGEKQGGGYFRHSARAVHLPIYFSNLRCRAVTIVVRLSCLPLLLVIRCPGTAVCPGAMGGTRALFSRLSLVAKNGWSKRNLRQPLFLTCCPPPPLFFLFAPLPIVHCWKGKVTSDLQCQIWFSLKALSNWSFTITFCFVFCIFNFG